MLTPQFGARGQRIDRKKSDLMSLALKLDHRLRRAARHPAAPWPALRLPRMWAGFRRHEVRNLAGKGPEFDEVCRRTSKSPRTLFQTSARHVFGLTLFPMDWVSNQLECATEMFAQLTPNLRRQTCRIDGMPDGLIGYDGASAFDFYSSCYRRARRDDKTTCNGRKVKLLVPKTDGSAAQLLQTVGYVS